MTDQNPIVFSDKQLQHWIDRITYPHNEGVGPSIQDRELATLAYQAGADKELELTLKLMRTLQIRGVDYIHRVRRPGLFGKTPSLKERLTTAIVNGDGSLAVQLLNEALPND